MEETPKTGLLPLRTFYFFTFAALGSFFPYLPLLLDDRGLSAAEISWVMVTIPVGGLVVPPLWGMAADVFHIRLPLLRLASIGGAGAVLLIYPEWGWIGSIFAVGLFAFFRSPIIPLADAATYDAMGGERADFSTVRLWGSVGFVLGVFTMGHLDGSHSPTLLVTVCSLAFLFSLVALWPLRTPPVQRDPEVLRDTWRIVTRPGPLLFLLGTVCYYAGHSTYDAYFGLHARALGLEDSFVGTAWAIAVSVEVGVMLIAPLFIHRLRSELLLLLCAGVAVLRWAGIATVCDPWLLAPLQGLHGITFGLWYLSMAKYVQANAPTRLRTALQSVAISALGLGMVVGYLAGGVLLEEQGGGGLYGAAAAAAAGALVFYAFCAGSGQRQA